MAPPAALRLQRPAAEEPDGVHDALELGPIACGRAREVGRVDHEPLAADLEDPDPVHLARFLLGTVTRPANRSPALEVALVAFVELRARRNGEREIQRTMIAECSGRGSRRVA